MRGNFGLRCLQGAGRGGRGEPLSQYLCGIHQEAETADAYIEKTTYEIAKKYRVGWPPPMQPNSSLFWGTVHCVFQHGPSKRKSVLRTGRFGKYWRRITAIAAR